MRLSARFAAALLLPTILAARPGICPAAEPARPGPQDRWIEVRDVLATSSPEQLLDMATERTTSLAQLLGVADDERSAREVAAACERCYFEIGMISIRITMLPPLSAAEQARLASKVHRFTESRLALRQQMERIAAAPAAAGQLQHVMIALKGDLQLDQSRAEQSVVAKLQTLRSQIELYKLMHGDRIPDFRLRGWKQLCNKTDTLGNVTDTGPSGPFLQAPPVNPLNQSYRILILRAAPKPDFRYEKNDCGWAIDETTGRIWAFDRDGRIFDESRGTARAAAE